MRLLITILGVEWLDIILTDHDQDTTIGTGHIELNPDGRDLDHIDTGFTP